MSEYQYYEWQCIDRPLTAEEQAAVNKLSSHIDVTSTRAVVTYNWGDLKHDPKQVLAQYFDAFLYYANWGSQQLMLRFPRRLINPAQLEPYLWEEGVELWPMGEYLILDIAPYEEGSYRDMDYEPSLSTLARLRDDILDGDFRGLYLTWLKGALLAGIDEEAEPPVPPGLGKLSAALAAFVRFFGLDPFLVEAAAQASPASRTEPGSPLAEAIARLPQAEQADFMLRLAQGEPHLSLILKRRLRELMGRPAAQPAGQPRRTLGALQAEAERLREESQRRAKAAAEAERIRALEALAQRAEQTWRKVDALVERKIGSAYDEATSLLVRLHDLAVYQGRLPEFEVRLEQFRARYANRPALLQRLQRVGNTASEDYLPEEGATRW